MPDIDFNTLFDEEEQEAVNTDTTDQYYYGDRGTLADFASLAGRGAIATLETLENAAEFFKRELPGSIYRAGVLDR